MRSGNWVTAAIALSTITQLAWGAGYDKSILWSGKYNGVAGAGAAIAHDSQALFFNPAGLANVSGLEASLNVSPTFAQAKGPTVLANQTTDGKTEFLPLYGVTVGYKLMDKLGLGIGTYIGGGSRADFESLDFSSLGFSYQPNAVTQIAMYEYAIGLGYEVLPGLKIGAAWRVLHVTGSLQTPVITAIGGTTPNTLIGLTLDGLSQTKFNGFRFGAQYDADSWGVGASVRTGVSFNLSGNSSATLQSLPAVPTPTAMTGGAATVASAFPVAGNLGAYVDLADKTFRLIGEYEYANYAEDQQVNLTGTLTLGSTSIDLSQSPIAQYWHDLHVGRLGLEYYGFANTVLRAGYALTGAVTPKDYARPTFATPGVAHSFLIGGGHSYMDKKLDLDVALEYSFASANVSSGDVSGVTTSTQPGDYSTVAYGAHLGVTYRF